MLLIYSGALLVDLIELDPVLMRFIYWCQDWTGLTFDNIMDEAEKIRITMMHCGMINRFSLLSSIGCFTMFSSCLKYNVYVYMSVLIMAKNFHNVNRFICPYFMLIDSVIYAKARGTWILMMLTTNLDISFNLQSNRLFKEGKFELAKAKYEKVIYLVIPTPYCFVWIVEPWQCPKVLPHIIIYACSRSYLNKFYWLEPLAALVVESHNYILVSVVSVKLAIPLSN